MTAENTDRHQESKNGNSGYRFYSKVRRIATEVARAAASSVDKDARFPFESIEALRRDRLLAAAIPREYGGLGCTVTEVADMCAALGQACASSAMIFAMHQIQAMCLARHSAGSGFFREYLCEAAERQWLLASGTSETGVGGHIRSSIAAVSTDGGRFQIRKQCSVLSYGEQADGILITARRTPEAAAADQVLALIRKQDYVLEQTGSWDTLGMRGTCSPAFTVTAEAECEQILPDCFRDIATQTMTPYSHILWSSVWLGVASDAVSIAQALTRQSARKRPETLPFGSVRLVDAQGQLQAMSAYIRDAAQEYEILSAGPAASKLCSISYALRMNNLKIAASRAASQICLECLGICGMAGYSNGSEYSVSRQLRDALSAPLMIANDRIASTNAALMLATQDQDAAVIGQGR